MTPLRELFKTLAASRNCDICEIVFRFFLVKVFQLLSWEYQPHETVPRRLMSKDISRPAKPRIGNVLLESEFLLIIYFPCLNDFNDLNGPHGHHSIAHLLGYPVSNIPVAWITCEIEFSIEINVSKAHESVRCSPIII